MSGASALHFLSNDDFALAEGNNGRPVMAIPGMGNMCLVLFYSTTCEHCKTLKPIFSQLPSVIRGVQFAMVNISTNKGIIAKAQRTNTPIEYVPLVIFYVNGMPFAQYTGNHSLGEIADFIKKMAERVQQKQQFAPAPQRTPVQQEMPPQAPPQQQQMMRQAAMPQTMPSAVTRPGNGGNGFNGPPPAHMQQHGVMPAKPVAKTPLDEESRPYKPTQACYMSFDDVYGPE